MEYINKDYINNVYKNKELGESSQLEYFIGRGSTKISQLITNTRLDNYSPFRIVNGFTFEAYTGTDFTKGYKFKEGTKEVLTSQENFASESSALENLKERLLNVEIETQGVTWYGLFQKEWLATMEATAIYTDHYWKTDFDFSSGGVSVSMGTNSFSESKTFNGEKLIPQVYELLQNVGLLETDEADYLFINVFSNKQVSTNIVSDFDDTMLNEATKKIGEI